MKNIFARVKQVVADMTRKQMMIAGGITLLVILMIVRNSSGNADESDRTQSKPVTVQIEMVSTQLVEQTVTAAGKIQPVYETEISSTVSAQIIELLVMEGDEVSAGDTLVILDSKRAEAAFERSRSGLRSAAARDKQVKAELGRGRLLYEKKLISLQDMEILEASAETAASSREQAKATLDQARDDLSKTVLIALSGGVVTRLNKEVGEMALGSTFQADVLLVISDLSSMEVIVDVDETDVVDVEILDMVSIEIDALPMTTFTGRVSRVAHSATVLGAGTQEQSTNFKVVVTLDINPDSNRIDPRLRPGMSSTATITTSRREDAIAVPIQALAVRQPVPPEKMDADGGEGKSGDGTSGQAGSSDGNGSSSSSGSGSSRGRGGKRAEPIEVVFVVVKDSSAKEGGFLSKLFKGKQAERVEQRPVKLGISSDTHYEILSGLAVDEEIVIGNYKAVSKELKDGSIISRKKSGEQRRGGNRRGGSR
ncbi:MAG: efflux RND transporter periplasmic adaptor subunit [Candidatus Marinimicrobia bacterium]|nr:efflux RND transporter periplasmic adaptor subunit [Candidatus Neomarinimicrobiota bacterium]